MNELEPGLGRLIAPNPSPMTERGTNTYLLGNDSFVVIDPGPNIPAHLDAIMEATGGRIGLILVTHAHLDHSPLAAPLAALTGAPVMAYGDARAGRSPVMEGLSGLGGGEGVDVAFTPTRTLADGEVLQTRAGEITAHWTPGHFGNHMAFLWREAAFSGDLVMGWASSFVSPPDGDLTAFMQSCRRLRALAPRRLYPGHGDPVENPAARIDWLLDHRQGRESQILAALQQSPGTPSQLAARIYTELAPAMLPAASRNVLAHLIDLVGRNLVQADGPPATEAIFRPR